MGSETRDEPAARAGAWRRHRRWVLLLLSAVLTYVVCMAGIALLHARTESEVGAALLVMALGIVGLVGPVTLLILAAVAGHRTYRAYRRGRGHLTAAERAQVQQAQEMQQSWNEARHLRHRLLARQTPPTLPVWDVVPYANENFFCDVPAGYARFYGTTAQYSQTSGFFVGRPAFVLAGLAATAMSNAAQRSAAERAAREQWREHAPCRLVVSNQRLLVQRHGQWLSFDYSTMTAVYPEPASWALVCQFANAEPLLVTGRHAPFAAVMTLFMTHGEQALHGHPALQPLLIDG